MNNPYLGKIGEETAVRYLRQTSFKVVEKNWKCEFGEIDIVAVKKDTLYFIEVKTRDGRDQESPEDAICAYKIAKLQRLAEFYSSIHPKLPGRLMLSAVCVTTCGKEIEKVVWYENILQ